MTNVDVAWKDPEIHRPETPADRQVPFEDLPIQAQEAILSVVQDRAYGGVTLDEILGRNGGGRVCRARHEAMARIRDITIKSKGRGKAKRAMFSYPDIGRFFGRNHSTAMHSIKLARML